MSHEFESGFSVREVPWHGLGTILQDYPGSWAEARTLAGLDWDPEERPVYDVDQLYADGTAKVKVIEGFKQVVRSDTGAVLDLAMDTYSIIDHATMGEILEAVMEAGDGTLRYETAGSLYEGKKVWALVRVGEQREIPGDPSPMQPYVALLNSHDGTAALRVIATNVRIVCANTWHAAEMDSEHRGSAFSFRHTRNWASRVEDAKKALSTTQAQIEATVEAARTLLQLKVNKMQREDFIQQYAIQRVIANTVGKKAWSKSTLEQRLEQPRVQQALAATISQLGHILDSRSCDGIRDTAWGLVQAGGEFADHVRESASPDSYFSRTVLADREPLKVSALKIAEKVLA